MAEAVGLCWSLTCDKVLFNARQSSKGMRSVKDKKIIYCSDKVQQRHSKENICN